MTDDEFWSATDELKRIHQWARARYAAPWAVFFAVLLRVAASTGPHVQLPGVIGGRASLNLLCAFVAPSGGGKGISDKVARLAWPAKITELPIGSGEGIAETFTLRGKESENNERITSAIFNCPEIDILTGLESRQGSTILGTLKAFAMGEQLGSTNASKANSRNVEAHTYRGCLSVSAQPGHTGVIFSDTSGGTPQRFLWALTIDPDMPDNPGKDPQPLNIALPGLLTRRHDDPNIVTEIIYGPDEIRQTIIASHLARQRGEGDALDGHWMLTRLKTAAAIAIMHHRMVVSDLDWQLSETVMAVSDRTRNWIVQQAQQAARAKIRDRAVARAASEDFYDASRLETVKRSIVRMLERDGEQPEGKLKARLGTRDKRDLFEQASGLLQADGTIASRTYEYNGRTITAWSTLTIVVNHQNPSSETMTTVVNHDHSPTVTDLDSRRSHETGQPELSCPAWLDQYVADKQRAGLPTLESFAVYADAQSAGHTKSAIVAAATKRFKGRTVSRGPNGVVWSIDPHHHITYRPVSEFLASYLAALPAGQSEIDKADYLAKGEAADYQPENLRKAVTDYAKKPGSRVELRPGATNSNRDTVWALKPEAAS